MAHSCTYPRQAIPPMLWQLTPNVSDDDDKLVMSVLYTTQFPPDLNDEADIKLHESRVAKGPEATGLALKGGTVLRYVEFSPGYTVRLHDIFLRQRGGFDGPSIIYGSHCFLLPRQ